MAIIQRKTIWIASTQAFPVRSHVDKFATVCRAFGLNIMNVVAHTHTPDESWLTFAYKNNRSKTGNIREHRRGSTVGDGELGR